MGHTLTKNESMLVTMLHRMLLNSGLHTSKKDLEHFAMFIQKISPWFLNEGSLTLGEWKKLGREMRKYVQENGEKTLPPQAFPLWLHIREILTEGTPFQGLCRETGSETEEPVYAEVAFEEGTPEELKPLQTGRHCRRKESSPENDDDDVYLDDEMAKKDWEDDFRDHTDPPPSYITMVKEKRPVLKPRKYPPLVPMGFQGAMAEARRTGDTTFGIFPVTEVWDEEPMWEPLPLKTLKELQQAVKMSGPSAPFTLQIVEMVASSWLTPYDWLQTAKATLSPGDYILWRTEYEDICKETIVDSIKKRGPKPTMAMFMGTGEYATPQSQTKIPRDILQIITTNAVQAWRRIPPSGTKGGALANIKQGTEETYQEL